MKPSEKTPTSFWVGAQVHWVVGSSKKEGQVIDIYKAGAVSGLSIRANRENDRVLVIQQSDGKVVMKLEGDVKAG
jgi:hypothetical protein